MNMHICIFVAMFLGSLMLKDYAAGVCVGFALSYLHTSYKIGNNDKYEERESILHLKLPS
jgi:hypothetical protein